MSRIIRSLLTIACLGTVAVAALAGDATEEKKVRCEPGKTFNDYCNTCACGEDGTTYGCTLMACDPELWNKDGTLKITTTVQSEIEEDFTTTEASLPSEKCEPGSLVKHYCNSCTCDKNGLPAACTLMACDEKIWNQDGTLKLGA